MYSTSFDFCSSQIWAFGVLLEKCFIKICFTDCSVKICYKTQVISLQQTNDTNDNVNHALNSFYQVMVHC